MVVVLDWKFVLIGFVLLGLSAFAHAAYNPYINNGYNRPYYTQFYSLPNIPRVGQIYYGTHIVNTEYDDGWESYSETVVTNPYSCYSCSIYSYTPYYDYPYYAYRSPALYAPPTVTVYTPPVIPVYHAVSAGFHVIYND